MVDALIDWYKRFGVSKTHVSDQGSHFKNEVVAEFNRMLGTNHHFTVPYTPWSNGTVEVVNKYIIEVLKSLGSEFRLAWNQWPLLLPVV